MAANSDLSNSSFLSQFLYGKSNSRPSGGGSYSPRPELGNGLPAPDVWVPVAGFYKTITDSFSADKAVASKKFFRFGPKATVSTAGNPLLRDQLLDEAHASIYQTASRSQTAKAYQEWLEKTGPEFAKAQAKPATTGEGIYQAGFSASDLKNPGKAIRREAETFAKAYLWDKLEKQLQIDNATNAAGEKFVLRHQVEEWGRVKGFLEDQANQPLLQEAPRVGLSNQEARYYLANKYDAASLPKKIAAAKSIPLVGALTEAELSALESLPRWEKRLGEINQEHSAVLAKGDAAFNPTNVSNYQKITGFVQFKHNSVFNNASTRHAVSVWLAPRAVGDHLFGNNGRLWQIMDFAKNPIKYSIKNYIWKANKFPERVAKWFGRESLEGLGWGKTTWEALGEYGTAYKAGIFSPAGRRILRTTPLYNTALGKIYRSINIRLLRLNILTKPIMSALRSTLVKLLTKIGLKGVLAAAGSVVPGLGTVGGFILGSVAEKMLKGIAKTMVWTLACACSCMLVVMAVPIAILLLIAGAFGANITQSFSGILTAANTAIFQPASASGNSDLVLLATASKRKDVGPNETITINLNVTAYAQDAGDISVSSNLDNNFSFGTTLGGGRVSDKEIRWPIFTLSKGQSKTFSFVVVTSAAMRPDTVALIKSSAVSTKYSTVADVYFNRVGASIGNDGKHAYPVLGHNSWQCFHGPPNFNAIDILATPGTPVVATISGRTESQYNILGGPVIFLYGDDGFNYYYAHLDIGARVTGSVSTGEIIGYISGNTIISRNNGTPHVHFSIDTRGNHNGPDTPAGPFLDAVGGTSKC